MCGVLMIQISALYALISIVLMAIAYLGLRRGHQGQRDLAAIFQGTMFQLTRWLQTTLQKSRVMASARQLEALNRRSDAVRRTPPRAFRSAPLDLPQTRVRTLHPTLSMAITRLPVKSKPASELMNSLNGQK